MEFLKKSTSPLPPLNVAKWLKAFVLFDDEELKEFFSFLEHVGSFSFYQVQTLTKQGDGIVSKDNFLDLYRTYISYLKRGEKPAERFQKDFSCALSTTPEAFYALLVDGERQIIKPILPIIQVQLNRVRYSSDDHSFRCQVYGEGTFTWGLQLAYPQIYQDPHTHEITGTEKFPNTSLFKGMQKWIRTGTRATPFIVANKKQNEPIRLGKKCFSWINGHPELKSLNIAVHVD